MGGKRIAKESPKTLRIEIKKVERIKAEYYEQEAKKQILKVGRI